MAIFYHVSTRINHSGKFVPRVPEHRHQGAEDDEIPRISVSPSIEECLSAIPNGGSLLDELNVKQKGLYLIFKIDTEELGIEEKDIIGPQYLYENDLVRDAENTKEHWIMKEFTVPDSSRFLIKLIAWDEYAQDVLPHSIYKIAEEKYDGDFLDAYRDIYEEYVPSSAIIVDLFYFPEDVEKGQEIEIYIDETEEKKLIKKFLSNHYQVDIKENSYRIPSLTFTMKEKANLRKLFLYEHSLEVS
ncbi:hypothetical protein QTG56_24210 (plasmid) [Rossellomorea sp. AcN35-11]|nr:hypothetical protein [Rossellomorea aquimaris]WJV31744.1 hypothetical protein QTG56_24210 [Rossellomorea sp. AcN35-11]